MEPLTLISFVVLWIIVLFNLLLTLGIVRRLNRQSSASSSPIAEDRLKPGEAAPPFSAQTMDGQSVSLETYAGQSFVLHFLSARCGPCREVLPDLLAIAPIARDAGVQFVFVLLDEMEDARALVEEFHIPAPVLVAPRQIKDGMLTNAFATAYKATSTPSYCLIDKNGLVQSAQHPETEEWRALEKSWREQQATARP